MKTYSRKKHDEPEEVILHLNELCRLCMTKEDDLVPIFNNEDAIPLTLRIMACVSLEVIEGDGLPNKICHPCRLQLEKTYLFRKKCEQSDSKLRHHLKLLHEKIGECEVISDDDEKEPVEELVMQNRQVIVSSSSEEPVTITEPSTVQDLVGVAQVAYIDPTEEPAEESAESITLPIETDHLNKEACTLLTQLELKKENEFEGSTAGSVGVVENMELEKESEDYIIVQDVEADSANIDQEDMAIEEQDLEAIAEAVKTTLSAHPGFNISGELELKVDSQPGKPTQVQVRAEDGSIVVMELMTEDDAEEIELTAPPVNEDGELKIFQCPDCPRSFARRIQLRRHASVHMQNRGYSCGICEKWFPTRSALIRHERIHTGERPFQCEICQKSFAQKEILYRHLMTHTGQKPYNCPHCTKGFTQKEPLRAHLRTHLTPTPSDIQLHCCTLCPKVFCHASGLSRHLVTHTGKTFKCRDCDKAFTDKSSLRRHHRQTMHQE